MCSVQKCYASLLPGSLREANAAGKLKCEKHKQRDREREYVCNLNFCIFKGIGGDHEIEQPVVYDRRQAEVAAMEMTFKSQGVVLVVIDLSKDVSSSAVSWALGNVTRRGDLLRLVGVITHVPNQIGFMSRVDKNTWNGSSRRSLEAEIANKRYMLHNIRDLDTWCKKAGVQLSVDVCVGQNPKGIVVDEAKNSGAYHVVVDKTMKKDRKYFIENLTCFVTRVRASGGAESIRSFAVSKPTPLPPAGGPTPMNTMASTFYMPSHSSLHSKSSSESGSSLRGSSVSSGTYTNQDFKEHHERLGISPLTKLNSMASTTSNSTSSQQSMGFDTSSCEDLFSINHEAVSERDASLWVMTPDHNADRGFVVRPDIPRNSIPRPQLHPRAIPTPSQIDNTVKTSTASGSGSPHVSKRVAVRSSKNNTLSRASSSNGSVQSHGSARSTGSGGSTGSGVFAPRHATSTAKTVWVWTKTKDVMTASVEGGWSTFIFTPETMDLAHEWTSHAKINPLRLEGGQFLNSENKPAAVLGEASSSEEVDSLPALMGKAEVVVMSASELQIIPVETLVAAFQESSTALYAIASTASDARVYLEAFEKGTDGIVLHTDDISEVFALKTYLKDQKDPKMGISLVEATVTQVESVGMGDRVCVDLCNLLNPGEGLLVGSFARALFLVHSECLESNHVASRPFRVNAGPVHAYVGMAGGRTSYLSELHTGSQVMVVDANGHTRSVLVGRVKIESRPLLLVEVEVNGQRHSVLLQNTESVCLVAPGGEKASNALPVTKLKVGDRLLLSLQEEARHIGFQIHEFLVEK